MHDSLPKHAAQLARPAMMIRIGLESAEAAIPGINDQLAELAKMRLLRSFSEMCTSTVQGAAARIASAMFFSSMLAWKVSYIIRTCG